MDTERLGEGTCLAHYFICHSLFVLTGPFDMSSSISFVSLLLFKNAREGAVLGAGQRRHLQALWGMLWK